jgi:hypothetical protein
LIGWNPRPQSLCELFGTAILVPDDGAILEEVAETEEHVLREVGYWNYEQCARLINNPCVVRLNSGIG